MAGRYKPKELNLAKADLGQEAWQKLKISWQQLTEEKLGIHPVGFMATPFGFATIKI